MVHISSKKTYCIYPYTALITSSSTHKKKNMNNNNRISAIKPAGDDLMTKM